MLEHYEALAEQQRAFFRTGATKDVAYRLQALERLRDGIRRYEQLFLDALRADLNKSEFEAYTTEIGIVLEEIRFTMKHLRRWARPAKVKTALTHIGSKGYVYPEPYGSALIIAPWNYPFQLAVAPLIGALAAGNCAVLKPSELTPRTSDVLATLIAELFPPEYVSVAQGGVETSQALLRERWNYVFFTGSVSVGRIVMEAAAKHLTPVTLELGGKSPCIVHGDANLKLAARRIAWGKFMNAGQTCVAPDYVYVQRGIRGEFVRELGTAIRELYGEQPLRNPNYTRIVSVRHYNRLKNFLQDGSVAVGGAFDDERLSIEPTVLGNVTWDSSVMQDEIFGPILPVLEYDRLSEAIEGIHRHPNPLALYVFSEDAGVQREVVSSVSFGGGCINDTVYHIASPYLPFGGVGASGIGAYHGKGSFDTFSHRKSVLKQTTRFDLPFRYPNYKHGLKIIKKLLK